MNRAACDPSCPGGKNIGTLRHRRGMSEAFDPYYKWLGIPPGQRPADFYRLLGINRFEDDPEVISHAADQRMAHLKTFQAGEQSALSQEILNQLAAAKLVLFNPQKKIAYDRQLRLSKASRFSPAGLLPVDSQFWGKLATAAVAVTLCVAAIVFWLSQGGTEKGMPGDYSGRPATYKATVASDAARHTPMSADPGHPAMRGNSHTAETTEMQGEELPAVDTQKAISASRHDQVPLTVPVDSVAAEAELSAEGVLSAELPEIVPDQSPPEPEAVFLDDLKQIDFEVGWGTLGKHGVTGYQGEGDGYGRRVVFRGRPCRHAVTLQPPARDCSYVAYNLQGKFQTFEAMAAVLPVHEGNAAVLKANPLFEGKAYSRLEFRVIGDGEVLWRSRPIQDSGDWQQCRVSVQGVSLLELQVDCPGTNAFAWAAWVEPQLVR